MEGGARRVGRGDKDGKARPLCVLCNKGFYTERGLIAHGCCDRGERTIYDDEIVSVKQILESWREQKRQLESQANQTADSGEIPERVLINGVWYLRESDALGMRAGGDDEDPRPPLHSPYRPFLVEPWGEGRGERTPEPGPTPPPAQQSEEEGAPVLSPQLWEFIRGTSGAAKEFFEVPYKQTFFACLNWLLIQENILYEFAPSELATSLCHSPDYPTQDTIPVHPTRSRRVMEFIARCFGLEINIYVCRSNGSGRRLVDMVGEWGSARVLNVCWVSEESELVGEDVVTVSWPTRKPPGARSTPAYAPLPPNAYRWIYLCRPQTFLQLHICRHECGSVFHDIYTCKRHEKNNCIRSSGEETLCRLRHSNKPCLPRLDLRDHFERNGFNVDSETLFVDSLSIYDLETRMVKGKRAVGEGRGKRAEYDSHSLFSSITSSSLDGEEVRSVLDYQAHYLDSYSMVSAMVGEWLGLALRQKALMEAKTAGLRRKVERELRWRERESPQGYFTRRLSHLLNHLRVRCGTHICLAFNGSRYDAPILVSNGLLHILRSLFPTVQVVKKDNGYMAITAWNVEEGVGIRILDVLMFHSPISLKNYLYSHRAQLSATPDALPATKGEFPYYAIGKTMDDNGEDSGYEFEYTDFFCEVKQRNTLNEEWEVWCAVLREQGGDVGKALVSGGWKEIPRPGPVVFADLQEEWRSQGLSTGLQILASYMRRDSEPLLRLTLIKARLIQTLTGRNLFHQYISISSFMFNWLLSQGQSGADGVTFYSLGARLTQLMRAHTNGGLSWVSNRYSERGMKIHPLRLRMPTEEERVRTSGAPFGFGHQDNKPEENENGLSTATGDIIRVYDANSMYAAAIGGPEMLHGRAISRLKSNSYAGELSDDKRMTSCVQIMGFLSEYMYSEPIHIQSEATSGEPYVVIDSAEHGAEIERVWHATVGSYKVREREWKAREKECGARETECEDGVRVRGQDLGDEEPMELEGEEEEESAEMADFIVEEGEEMEVDNEVPPLRRILSDSSHPHSPSSPPPSAAKPAPRKAPPSSARFKLRKGHYRFRVDGLIPNPLFNLGMDDVSELYSRQMSLEDDLPLQKPSKGTIIEECPNRDLLEREPNSEFTRKYFNRTYGQMIAEDSFRLHLLKLDYQVVEIWVCQWERLKADPRTAVSRFCASFILPGGASSFPLEQTFSEGDILAAVLDGRMNGLILADFYIPEESRLSWSSVPPVILKRMVTVDDMESPFREYAIFNGYNKKGIKYLTSQFTGTQILITTHYAKSLVEMAQARISSITEVIELKRTEKLKGFVDKCVALRRQADAEGNASMASFSKLAANSSFGYSLIKKHKYLKTKIGLQSDCARAMVSGRFYSGTEVGRPGPRQGELYELSQRPRSAGENAPVILGFTVLNTAKVALLRFVFQLTYFLRPGAWSITGGDTDSVMTFLSHSELEPMVREERIKEWLEKKWDIFVNPSDPLSARKPGLWKTETEGTSLLHLSSKLYSISNADTGLHKVAARGASLANNRIALSHATFYQALLRPLKFEEHLKKHGLRVTGYRRLSPADSLEEEEEEVCDVPQLLDWANLRRLVDSGGVRYMERASAAAALDWEREEERTRLAALGVPHRLLQDPCTITNISFLRDKQNIIRTVATNKTVLLSLFAKRKCIGDGSKTIPLAEPSLPE